MKKKTGLLICVSALVLSLGVTLGIEAAKNKAESAKVAEAAYENNEPLNVYLKVFSGWLNDNATIVLKLTWSSGDEWVDLNVANTYYFNYSIENAHDLVGLQFARTNGGNPTTESNIYNYGSYNSDLSKTFCEVTGWWNNTKDCPSNWTAIGSQTSGNSNGLNEHFAPLETTPTTLTKRVWVNPKDNFFDSGARAGLRVFKGDKHYITYVLTNSAQCVSMTHESKSQLFFYIDIPLDHDCQLVRLHNNYNVIWTYSGNFSSNDWDSTLIMFSWTSSASLSPGGLDNQANYTVEYAERVLDGFSTCESSEINGYGAYGRLDSNILSKSGIADNMSTLRAAEFNAPGYGTRTYGEKIDLMATKRSSGRIFNNVSLSSTANADTAIIVVVSAVAAVSVGGFFFLKKKH